MIFDVSLDSNVNKLNLTHIGLYMYVCYVIVCTPWYVLHFTDAR